MIGNILFNQIVRDETAIATNVSSTKSNEATVNKAMIGHFCNQIFAHVGKYFFKFSEVELLSQAICAFKV